MANLEQLMSLRENVDLENEQERHNFLWRIFNLIEDWSGQLPNLREIFRKEEIECLLSDSVKLLVEVQNEHLGMAFISFVCRSGYRDEPDVDENGQILLRRTTPLHHAARQYCPWPIDYLLTIYDRFDVNYVDEFGLTHFHVACIYGRNDVVVRFLDSGLNSNLPVGTTLNMPLHLALSRGFKGTAKLLLRRGADPTSVNEDGDAPLLLICKRLSGDNIARTFFNTCDGLNKSVPINITDRSGRTPLQWAVSNVHSDTVDMLLTRGADLSKFVYPDMCANCDISKLNLAIRTVEIIEHLKKRGYELVPSVAVKIMTFFANNKMFEKPMDLENWYDDEKFATEAKEIQVREDLSLYDLTRLRPEQAEKQLTLENYKSINLFRLARKDGEACSLHLCEKFSRKFFRLWARDPFMALTHYRLPLLCCEKIFENLNNEDLYIICLAAAADQHSQ